MQRSLGLIDRETTRLAHLVDNVLRFAKPTSQVASDTKTAQISDDVRDAVRSFQPLADARKVRIEEAIEPGLLARVDPHALRQVVLNYLDNAVKYGPQGATVLVRVQTSPDDPGRVRLEVADRGPGVPENERARIWEAFQRGSGPSVAAAGGSGIGLSVVREIVVAAGGEVAVEEGVDGGAVFRAEFLRG